MIKVIRVEPLKNQQYLVAITKEETEESIQLHAQTVLQHHLLRNPSFQLNDWLAVLQDDLYHQAMEQALSKLNTKTYATLVLKNLLLEKYPENVVKQVIESLTKLNYLNDQETLQTRIKEIIEFQHVGPVQLKSTWLKLGYPNDLIEQVLSEYTIAIETEKCQDYIAVTHRKMKQAPHHKMRFLLRQKALQKGFHREVIEDCLNAIDDVIDDAAEYQLLVKRFNTLKPQYDLTNHQTKQKLIQKLLREGFVYEHIRTLINEGV